MLSIVGFGAGGEAGMTIEAREVLESCDVIAGYRAYVELLKPLFPGKVYYATGMTREKERCLWALQEAAHRHVALVCSGDSGVYGMAGLALELAGKEPAVQIRVTAGVTAANSGAALLGAPLGHDFAVISLSDLLTPMPLIEKRLACAAMADLVICLYNPSSAKREGYLKKACDIVLRYRGPETVCGYAQNIGRQGERARVLCLKELREEKLDMFTTVYIGNSMTEEIGGKMVTPRGYCIG